MPRKSLKVKRPSWKIDNGVKRLSKMGLILPRYRTENNVLAKFLKAHGYEFWDSCCISDYDHDFNGYTLSFRKTIIGRGLRNPHLFFRWYWADEMDVYWTAELNGSFDFEPDKKNYHPWANFEVRNITEQSLKYLPTYENAIVRSLADVANWSAITLTA